MSGTLILIEASPGEVRGALVRNGAVRDIVHHRAAAPSLVGAAYRGRVRRIEPGINGAFVDIGLGREAFLRARDASEPGKKAARKARIAEILHEGAQIDVRIVADGFAEKGPRVARIEEVARLEMAAPAELVAPRDPVAHILDAWHDGRRLSIVCNDAAVENAARAWAAEHDPDLAGKIERGRAGLFAERGVEEAIEGALARRVQVPGGAELVFDQTEALCVIDVNSAGAVGKAGRGARDVNMQAMGEIARQLRLRNIAGAVVIDALKMGSGDDRNRVLVRLREALKGDPGGCHVLGMTNLGLIEVTRTRIGPTLAERLLGGSPEPGLSPEATAYAALRGVLRATAATPAGGYSLRLAPPVAALLTGRLQPAFAETAQRVGRLDLVADAEAAADRFEVVLGSGPSETKAS